MNFDYIYSNRDYYFCGKKVLQMKYSRQAFLRLLTAGILAWFVFIWNKLTVTHIETEKRKKRIFPFNRNKNVSFAGSYIIVNEGETTKVLSAHCTHLGCVINQIENGRLVCPCHGSEYDLNGRVIKGPAYKNLEIIPSKIISDGTQVEIEG